MGCWLLAASSREDDQYAVCLPDSFLLVPEFRRSAKQALIARLSPSPTPFSCSLFLGAKSSKTGTSSHLKSKGSRRNFFFSV